MIGGGPAGASAAAILAENGRSVIVLEREPFPRYHVGESLLPALWELWDRLGVTAQIEAAGFVVSRQFRFARPDDPDDVVLLSAEYPEYFPRSYTYHVDRARFDAVRRRSTMRAAGVPTCARAGRSPTCGRKAIG